MIELGLIAGDKYGNVFVGSLMEYQGSMFQPACLALRSKHVEPESLKEQQLESLSNVGLLPKSMGDMAREATNFAQASMASATLGHSGSINSLSIDLSATSPKVLGVMFTNLAVIIQR